MKIRMGFVPNSSSSSFIVSIWSNIWDKKKKIVDEALEEKLKKYGFKKTHVCNPDQFEMFAGARSDYNEQEGKGYNYGYEVTCNQDDIIRFLVKHRIPFKASIHYGHYTYFYDGKDLIYSFPNYGLMFYKEGTDMEKDIGRMLLQERGIEQISITQFMNKADQKRYIDEERKKWDKLRKKIQRK